MRWLAGVAIGYVFLMLLAIGSIQYVARADRRQVYDMASPDRLYLLRAFRDAPIPAIFGDRGRWPGQLEVVDTSGRVLDAEHVPDVFAVNVLQWERYRVDFQYRDGSRTYQSALNLAQ